MYSDALLAHCSYPSSTTSSGKTSVAGDGCSSALTALYSDALLAHCSYPSSTTSSGKMSVAAEGSARKDASLPEEHPELQPWGRYKPPVHGPPRGDVTSGTDDKRPGGPVAELTSAEVSVCSGGAGPSLKTLYDGDRYPTRLRPSHHGLDSNWCATGGCHQT
ncbi:hypothetical protein MRX96_043473 [Rhipicephalus microplus]